MVRYLPNCHNEFATFVHGTKAAAQFSGAIHAGTVHTYKDQRCTPDNIDWQAPKEEITPWQAEWNVLLDAIRNDRPHNEAKRAALSNLADIMGRAAMHSGKIDHLGPGPGLELPVVPEHRHAWTRTPSRRSRPTTRAATRCPCPASGRRSRGNDARKVVVTLRRDDLSSRRSVDDYGEEPRMTKTVRWGVIGLGWFGEVHAEALVHDAGHRVGGPVHAPAAAAGRGRRPLPRRQAVHQLPATCWPIRTSTWSASPRTSTTTATSPSTPCAAASTCSWKSRWRRPWPTATRSWRRPARRRASSWSGTSAASTRA